MTRHVEAYWLEKTNAAEVSLKVVSQTQEDGRAVLPAFYVGDIDAGNRLCFLYGACLREAPHRTKGCSLCILRTETPVPYTCFKACSALLHGQSIEAAFLPMLL